MFFVFLFDANFRRLDALRSQATGVAPPQRADDLCVMIIVVTNQVGVAHGLCGEANVHRLHAEIALQLAQHSASGLDKESVKA